MNTVFTDDSPPQKHLNQNTLKAHGNLKTIYNDFFFPQQPYLILIQHVDAPLGSEQSETCALLGEDSLA